MSDPLESSVATDVWEKRLAQYQQALGVNIGEMMDEEWPFLIHKIIDFTPPFKTKPAISAAGSGFGQSDYSVGRKAVMGDIHKVMRPFDPTARTAGLAKIEQKRDIEAFNIVAARSSNAYMQSARAIAFDPLVHTSARNARGRVTGPDRNQVVLGSDVALMNAYVKKVQGAVGFAKSGWIAAYNLVRAPDGWLPPNWVTKQGGAGGGVIDERANPDAPSVTARNWTAWAVRKDEAEQITANAYASRINSIKLKIQAKLKLARQQAELNGNDLPPVADPGP